MQQIPNPMANLYQTQLEASRRFADAFFAGTEKLDRLVLEATHRAVSDQLSVAQAMANGADTAGGANLATTLMQRNSNGAVNYQAEIIRVVSEMQTEMGKSMQDYIEQIGSQAASVQSRATQSAQGAAGATAIPDAMTNPMTSMLSLWESAFRDATALASRNMSAARSTMERAASTTEGTAEAVRKTASEAAEGASTGGGSRRK